MTTAELCIDAHTILGEGPIWDEEANCLYWVDISGRKLFRYDPARQENISFDIGQPVGTVVPRASGGVVLAVQHGFAAYDLDGRHLTPLVDPEPHLPDNRFNDGKCDPAGRFWAGTMAFSAAKGAGALYRLDTDLGIHKMLANVTISNGIVWSLDHKTLYYIDSQPGTVTAFAYDVATGAIDNGRVIIQVPPASGAPDGMAIDSKGMLWIAHYGGGCVRRWHPATGEILQTIRLPVSRVTACAFGGPRLDTLYITTASQQMTAVEREKEPHAGGLFAVQPGGQGVATFRFGG